MMGIRWRIVLGPVLGATLVAVSTPTIASAEAALSIEPQTVISQFEDGEGRRVVLREGYWSGRDDGFGWTKITRKHAITSADLVRWIIENPNGGKEEENI